MMRRVRKTICIDGDDAFLGRLGEELAMEILVRVPAKSLCKFKCVSKEWYRLISHPLLALSYSALRQPTATATAGCIQQFHYLDIERTPPSNEHIRFLTFTDADADVPLDPSFSFLGLGRVFLVASSKGLLLCADSRINQMRYFICNPITKQWLALPQPPRQHIVVHAILHCYNDDHQFHKHDQQFLVPNKFLVVRFSTDPLGTGELLQLETFSSETGQWKMSDITHPPSSFNFLPCRAIFHSSAYWVDNRDGRVAAYDLNKETLRFLPPPPACDNPVFGCLGVSDGLLHYAESNKTCFRIWVLCHKQSEQVEWSLKHTVSLQTLIDHHPHIFTPMAMLGARWLSQFNGHRLLFLPLAFNPFNPNLLLLNLPGMIVSFRVDQTKLEVVYPYRDYNKVTKLRYYALFPHTPSSWPTPIPAMRTPCC